ncbi:MAG: hypothetical protein RMH84_00435 [Sulfolobales archaeon]|nr:hypothetical protein [Sulfolobales archaeon]MCX8209195.1 hypothetical protein [Sulfolobales archaeon]MDW8010055.1 hypothetical protein [Sulfolobales archaeon]
MEVEKLCAERAIRILRDSELLLPSASAKSGRTSGVVRVPVRDGLSEVAADILRSSGIPSELCVDVFKVSSRRVRFTDLLKDVVPGSVLERIPRSYQQIGGVAVIHLPEDLVNYGSVVGEAIARVSPSVKAVYASSTTEGEFRTRKLRKIWGEDIAETVHVEYGVKVVLNVERVYYNPTLSYEHWRISEEVSDSEVVLDLFSGIGPYSLHIAFKRRATCFAVDSNPWASIYLARSIALNKLRGRVVPVLSRAEDFLELAGENYFTRAIVDLPHRSLDYLGSVLRVVTCGGTLHVYSVSGEEPPAPKLPGGARLVEVRRVLDYAPRKYVYGLKIVKLCAQ